MNKYFIILFILSTLSVVKSSLETCTFPNYNSTHMIDMSPLKGNNYSILVDVSISIKYNYTFSVCSENNYCSTNILIKGVQSCVRSPGGLFETGHYNNSHYNLLSPTSISSSSSSSPYTIQIYYNASALQKGDNILCPSGNYRSINYFYKCGSQDLLIVNVTESPMCVYNFYISSKYACPVLSPSPTPSTTPSATPSTTPSPTPSTTPSTTPSPTPSTTPSTTPSPTPSTTPSATPSTTPSSTPSATSSPTPSPIYCESDENGLFVNSTESIVCIGTGKTSCITSEGSTCGTDQTNGNIRCAVPSTFISCTGNHIVCKTSFFTCKINTQLYSGLNVNDLVINSNTFGGSSEELLTKQENVQNQNNSSSTLTFSSIFILIILILSLIL
ncbi:hypothetical protein ACTA71_004011 [Dictyostelium dimigraforme]